MYRVVKNLTFCYGHRLLNHPGKCAHVHGHNGVVEVEFGAQKLNAMGMVIDFDEIKSLVQTFLDEALDHKMILFREDPLVDLLQKAGESVYVMEENPTAENIAKMIFHFVRGRGLPITSVRLWETPTACAGYSE
jgi:6-pyruvoyltetrahydropterin/6-carboxytetrahydropterin synthase